MNFIKKAFRIAKITIAVTVALFLIFCFWAITSSDPVAEPAKAEPKQEAKPVEAPKEEPKPEVSQEAKEQAALSILQQNYKGIAEVTFDPATKAFNILPIEKEFSQGLALMASGDQSLLDEYKQIEINFQKASKSMVEPLGSGYMLNLSNPMNPENSLLIIMDGIIMYSFQ